MFVILTEAASVARFFVKCYCTRQILILISRLAVSLTREFHKVVDLQTQVSLKQYASTSAKKKSTTADEWANRTEKVVLKNIIFGRGFLKMLVLQKGIFTFVGPQCDKFSNRERFHKLLINMCIVRQRCWRCF